MNRLRAMRTFESVARQRSFSGGARKLGISPPAATRAVAMLEDRLGMALFHRSTRAVSLTERGETYLGEVTHILQLVEAAERTSERAVGEIRGEVKITAPVMFGRLHVLPVIETVLLAHPDLSIDLLLLDRNVRLEAEGIDLAVRIGNLADTSLRAKRIGTAQRIFVASPAYVEEYGEPAHPRDLADHRTILMTAIDERPFWSFKDDRRQRIKIQPRIAINSVNAAVTAAIDGIGITRPLDYQVKDAIAKGQLVSLLDEFREPPVPIQLLFSIGSGQRPAVRALIDALIQQVR